VRRYLDDALQCSLKRGAVLVDAREMDELPAVCGMSALSTPCVAEWMLDAWASCFGSHGLTRGGEDGSRGRAVSSAREARYRSLRRAGPMCCPQCAGSSRRLCLISGSRGMRAGASRCEMRGRAVWSAPDGARRKDGLSWRAVLCARKMCARCADDVPGRPLRAQDVRALRGRCACSSSARARCARAARTMCLVVLCARKMCARCADDVPGRPLRAQDVRALRGRCAWSSSARARCARAERMMRAQDARAARMICLVVRGAREQRWCARRARAERYTGCMRCSRTRACSAQEACSGYRRSNVAQRKIESG
jgi:hypothetical protein